MNSRKTSSIIVIAVFLSILLIWHYHSKLHYNEEILQLKSELSTYKSRFEITNEKWDMINDHEYFSQSNEAIDKKLSRLLPQALNDDYSTLIKNSEFDAEWITKRDRYGFSYIEEDGQYIIWSITPESPADRSCLEPGDKIALLFDIPFAEMDSELRNILLYNTTQLDMTVEKPNKTFKEVVIEKARSFKPIVEASIVDNSTGYIKLSAFEDSMFISIQRNLSELKQNGVDHLIIDLRHNGGGSMNAAKYILDLFIEHEPLYMSKGRDGHIYSHEAANKYDPIDFDIVVLVDRHTASASEILASSLKENCDAVIIGETTFGKGILQHYITYDEDYILKLTTHEMFANEASAYHESGLIPDIEVESRPWITPERDDAFDAAIEHFNN